MLKISFQPATSTKNPVLALEGRVAGEWVSELRRVYDAHHTADRPLTIDLRDVTFIDRRGVEFFDEVYGETTLINCSLFAAEQLKSVFERRDEVGR